MYKVIEKRNLNPAVGFLKIEAPLVSRRAEPGQFIILRASEEGERTPFTIYDYDREQGTVSIIFQIVGSTTRKLDSLNVGDYILDVVGPLGKAVEFENVKDAIVVGGGVGCAIAYPIVKKFHDLKINVTSIVGFRSKDLVILEDEFKKVSNNFFLMTDDGSHGEKGLVTDALRRLLEKKKYDKVYVIGPLIMMKFVSLLTKEFNTPTIVSMNSIMVDGTGMCGGCRVTVGGEVKFACVDGPDFDGHLIDFDEAIQRSRIYVDVEKKRDEETCNLFKVKKDEYK